MNVVMLLLFPVGLILFGTLANVMRPVYSFSFTLDPHNTLLAIFAIIFIVVLSPLLLIVLTLIFHEWCHGLAFRWAGAKPRYGAKLVKRILPILYATAAGKWLTKRQYLVVALAPTVLVNLVGVALMWPPTLLRYLLVLPLVANFCGCVGDWWMTLFILKLPASTMIEDTQEGFRYRYEPPA